MLALRSICKTYCVRFESQILDFHDMASKDLGREEDMIVEMID